VDAVLVDRDIERTGRAALVGPAETGVRLDTIGGASENTNPTTARATRLIDPSPDL
jgi:hypothetical protein